ncbi:MAG: dockerin type I repeat-containing protein [Armatimonadota bacterium]
MSAVHRLLSVPLLLTAALASVCLAAPGASSTRGVLGVKNVTAPPGGVANVEIVMDSALRSVAAVQFILDFRLAEPADAPLPTPFPADPDHPQNGEALIALGPMVPQHTLNMASGAVKGTVQVAIAGVIGFDGPGTLVTIPLQVPQNTAPGTVYNLQLTVLVLNGPYLNPLPYQTVSGYLRIVRPYRFMVTGTSALPGREVILPVAYWAGDGGAPQGASITVEAQGSKEGADSPSILAVEVGPAYSSAGLFFTPIKHNQARVMILSARGPLKTGSVLFSLRIHIPASAEDGDVFPVRISDVKLPPMPEDQYYVSAPTGAVRISIPPGDLNADGSITVADALLCLRIALRLTWPVPQPVLKRADVMPKNHDGTVGDGLITVVDVARILRRALGLDEGPRP